MQFHHHGYVSADPRREPAAGSGIDRPEHVPDEVDVLIVGAGPAGMIAAAQLAQFSGVVTRIIERRPERLSLGQADGIQPRSVETFQAFGFAERITEEAFRITQMAFWKPDPEAPEGIVRTGLLPDDPAGVSEFPHLIVNQARVQDYLAEFAANSPARIHPDYGVEFLGLEISEHGDRPVRVRIADGSGEREIRAAYVVGCDGARSAVRQSIGVELRGSQAMHAWGVMDVLAVTDFPDIRLKCAIQSRDGGNILLIPREGGHLFRMYVDLGEVESDRMRDVRSTTIDQIIGHANRIIAPYRLDVREVAWHSVYEVGHRLADRFDDVPADLVDTRSPRVFIAGDACHTHSAKAGQGMNVSMQDGWNIAWKLGHVLDGRSSTRLLGTYSAERQVVAKNLIDFDREWSTLMATRPEDRGDPVELEDFYIKTFEFPAGFMTEYAPSMIVAEAAGAADGLLAGGFPVGRRFRSAPVVRVADANPAQLGHHARADGRWRIYAFADAAPAGTASALGELASWLDGSPDSPVAAARRNGSDPDALLDIKVIYQETFDRVDLATVPRVFLPSSGRFGLTDYEKVYAADPDADIFSLRQVDRRGAIVVVRPDQYVAAVLPLHEAAHARLAEFFRAASGALALTPRR